jgi:hypothetical protein
MGFTRLKSRVYTIFSVEVGGERKGIWVEEMVSSIIGRGCSHHVAERY